MSEDNIMFTSASCGQVKLCPHNRGHDFRTPEEVARALDGWANAGVADSIVKHGLPIDRDAWRELRACFVGMAMFAEPIDANRKGLVDPTIFTDNQLRAECERRGVDVHWYCGCGFSHEDEAVTVTHEQTCPESEVSLRRERDALHEQLGDCVRLGVTLTKERDEWKRRAEAAEARNSYAITPVESPSMTTAEKRAFIEKADAIINAAMRSMKPSPEAVRAVLMNEAGPGIAAMPKRDDTLDQATLADLLAEDAP
jgi:hypothetical protein